MSFVIARYSLSKLLEVTDKIGDHHTIDFVLEVHEPNTRTQQKHDLDCIWANFELMKEELGSIDYED
ncbi:hypothetical protein FHG87_002322 [Trinorchestia longiramus]|nr:hypothetical protein FHG87_002322 [Trinorchestia longiramus]